jgi:hypothetical protein
MDRQETLRRLDQIVEPGGAVVLFGDDHPNLPDNRWLAVFMGVIDRFGEGDAAHAEQRALDWLRHEAILLDSPFPSLERVAFLERRDTPLETLVDRALSLSRVSPERLGGRTDDLTRELREILAGFARTGKVTEVVESEALIARRTPPL